MKSNIIALFAIKWLTFLVAIFCAVSLQSQQWTLTSCVKQAINNHPDIKSAQLDLGISMAGVDQAKSNFYPEIGASVFQSGNFGRSIDRFTNAYIDQFYNTTYAGIRLNMPLFTSFRNTHLLASAKSSKAANESAVDKNKNILTLTVINQYIFALSQAENIRNAVNQWKNDSIQYQRLLIRKEAGLTTKTEEIQLMNQMKTDELTVMDAKLNYETAIIDLSQSMNTSLPTSVILSPLLPDETYFFDRQNTITETLPEITELKLGIQSLTETIKATRALSYPSIGLNADYGTFYASSNPERSFAEQLNDTRNGSISLGLNIPILRGLQNRPQVQELKVRQMALQNTMDKTQMQIRQEIEMASARYQTYKKRYENARFLLTLANENILLITEQLTAGTVTMVDYLLAQNNMEKASAALTNSKYQLILQEKILKFYTTGQYDLD
jgi:outer membrane protein